MGVTFVEGFLDGGGDQVVAFFLEEESWFFEFSFSCTGEAFESSVLSHVRLDFLGVETIWVVNGGVVFNNGGDLATIFDQEVRSPIADSTETLNNESAVFDTFGEADFLDESLVRGHLTDGVVDTETSGFSATIDTALSDELASAATFSVDIGFSLHIHVGIFDPGHDLLVSTHVWSETVDSGTDETLLDKLHSVLAGHTFELGLGKFTRVYLDTTLATTEWNISDSEFEGHEGSESLNFLKIHMIGVTSTTFAGEFVS